MELDLSNGRDKVKVDASFSQPVSTQRTSTQLTLPRTSQQTVPMASSLHMAQECATIALLVTCVQRLVSHLKSALQVHTREAQVRLHVKTVQLATILYSGLKSVSRILKASRLLALQKCPSNVHTDSMALEATTTARIATTLSVTSASLEGQITHQCLSVQRDCTAT